MSAVVKGAGPMSSAETVASWRAIIGCLVLVACNEPVHSHESEDVQSPGPNQPAATDDAGTPGPPPSPTPETPSVPPPTRPDGGSDQVPAPRDGAIDMDDVDAGGGPAMGDAGPVGMEVDAGADAGDVDNDACDWEHPCPGADERCRAGHCEADPEAPPTGLERSVWSGRAGWIDSRDRTHFCTPDKHASGRGASSHFERVSSDGTRETLAAEPDGAQRLRLQCQRDVADASDAVIVTSGWSSDAEGDALELECPLDHPQLAYLVCQVVTSGWPAYVYAGTACGDGVSDLRAAPELVGQMLGDHYELTTSTTAKPLLNNTKAAGVIGTDLGYQFVAHGRLEIGFGDTWENESSIGGPLGLRGSVLAHTQDLDPSDGDGIAIDGWETMADRPAAAREIIPSIHGTLGVEEFTAIATSGVGLTEGDTHYRFLWFASIRNWDPFESIESTLAWSINGGDFVRGDQAPDFHPPRWPHATYFGPGAMWLDREAGMVYFVGVRTYVPESPLRIARVRATASALRDHLQYEYWTGERWQRPNRNDEYALASLEDTRADLMPGSHEQSNRPEYSLAYNAYAGRYVMIIQHDLAPFETESATDFQLWQAKDLTGPWQEVDSGDKLLRMGSDLYGAYMSEHLMRGGGRDMYFLMSEWNLLPLFLGQPYSVGLWQMGLARHTLHGCQL